MIKVFYLCIIHCFRHDACLLAWSKSISAIPVLWARGQDEELYVFHRTQMAIPVHRNGFIQNFIENLNLKYFLYTNENNYIAPTQRMLREKNFRFDLPLEELYLNVQLVLWGADPILRVNFALLTQLVAEVRDFPLTSLIFSNSVNDMRYILVVFIVLTV